MNIKEITDAERARQAEQDRTAPLATHDEDECCGRHISKALRSGALDKGDAWTCPKCGTEWKVTCGPIRHWSPCPIIEVFGAR